MARRQLVIHFHLRIVPNRPDDLIAAGNDLVAGFEPAHHFDIGSAGDACFHFAELGLFAIHNKDALNFFFHLLELVGSVGGRLVRACAAPDRLSGGW